MQWTESDKKVISEAFTALAELYEKDMSPVASRLYLESLKEFPADKICDAISLAIKKLRWFPKPAELIELITGKGSIDDIAQVQAGLVIDTIRRHGSNQSVRFDDPVTTMVIKRLFGSWPKACEVKESEVKWFIKDFVSAYKAYSSQNVSDSGYLPGRHEINNAARGYFDYIPETIQIGHTPINQIEHKGAK